MSEAGIQGGQLQDFTIDQLAGALALSLGAVGTLLLVIWQSKCHCKMNLCYIFTCERRPPSEEEMKGLKEKVKNSKAKKDIEKKQILKDPSPSPEPEQIDLDNRV